MIKELLFNKESYTKKYIGLKCIIPKGTEYFNTIHAGGFNYPTFIENDEYHRDMHYYVDQDIKGEITSVILGYGENNTNTLTNYYIVQFKDQSLPGEVINAYICRKSDVKIISGGVINRLLTHVHQLLSHFFRKELA